MIKFFHKVVPKNNELSSFEISKFFLKNLHILIIITFIISFFFYFIIKSQHIPENKYSMVASGYLVPGKYSQEADLEIINSGISEIINWINLKKYSGESGVLGSKLSIDPEKIILLTNLEKLINYSHSLLSSHEYFLRLIDSKLKKDILSLDWTTDLSSILVNSELNDSFNISKSIYLELIIQDFGGIKNYKNYNDEDLIRITRDFINKHISLVTNEMRERYLGSIDVLKKLLIEESLRLENMIIHIKSIGNEQSCKNRYDCQYADTYSFKIIEIDLSLKQIPYYLKKTETMINNINKLINSDLINIYDNEILIEQRLVVLDKNRANLFQRFSTIQILFFFSIFVFFVMFLIFIFINNSVNESNNYKNLDVSNK